MLNSIIFSLPLIFSDVFLITYITLYFEVNLNHLVFLINRLMGKEFESLSSFLLLYFDHRNKTLSRKSKSQYLQFIPLIQSSKPMIPCSGYIYVWQIYKKSKEITGSVLRTMISSVHNVRSYLEQRQ